MVIILLCPSSPDPYFMKLRTTFFFLIMLNAPLFAQPERTDVIIMKNGDRITCEITGVKYGTLYARLDYVDGIVEIDWSKVAKVESNRLFIIKTEDGSVHEGRSHLPNRALVTNQESTSPSSGRRRSRCQPPTSRVSVSAGLSAVDRSSRDRRLVNSHAESGKKDLDVQPKDVSGMVKRPRLNSG
jgi:hypothetical protein